MNIYSFSARNSCYAYVVSKNYENSEEEIITYNLSLYQTGITPEENIECGVIESVSTDLNFMRYLAQTLANNDASPIHIYDIVEDFVVDFINSGKIDTKKTYKMMA